MGCCKKKYMLNNQRCFVNPHRPDDVYKLKRAFYGHGFTRGFADTTLFIRNDKKDFVVAQIYVDDIVFDATNDSFAKYFANEMKKMFEMSMVGELTYFLGLQVKQTDSGIYINQAKYARNLVKRFGLDKVAHARTPMAANAKLTNDPSGEFVDVTLYRSMIS